MTKIPYKINLSEDELPKYWQNIRPYMQEAPDPFINPVTFKPCTADDLRPVLAISAGAVLWKAAVPLYFRIMPDIGQHDQRQRRTAKGQ